MVQATDQKKLSSKTDSGLMHECPEKEETEWYIVGRLGAGDMEQKKSGGGGVGRVL